MDGIILELTAAPRLTIKKDPLKLEHNFNAQPASAADLDPLTARKLAQLTTDFYQRTAASFSSTRENPWPGWEHVWQHIEAALGPLEQHAALHLLDVGCGNLRFERFLESKAPNLFESWALDNCPDLALRFSNNASICQRVHLIACDVISSLLDDAEAPKLLQTFGAPPCDIAVAFGFLHHIPGFDARCAFLEALVQSVRPKGLVVVSLWQPMNDPRLHKKALETTAQAQKAHSLPPLPPNDYLLGWQHMDDVFRYCHHFTEAEVCDLASALAPNTRELARFSADGKSQPLNRYLVLQRQG